jgi:hypothetical protein
MQRRPNGEFAPTQPEEEYQSRLLEQKRWRRLGPFVPNQVPVGQRFAYGVLTLTWGAWGVIGLLSGHMFLLISRTGPVHFEGFAALLFAGAVLASAVICALKVVDHFDRRDNEAIYQFAHRWLIRIAVALFLVSCVVGCIPAWAVPPATAESWGALSNTHLRSLFESHWLTARLRPLHPSMTLWLFGTFAWLVVWGLVLRLLGLGSGRQVKSPILGTVALYVVAAPALAAFTLNLVWSLVSGEMPTSGQVSEAQMRARFAWQASMLVACIGAWLSFVVITALLVIRLFGYGREDRAVSVEQ